jgi:predicted transcriptional regulator
MPWTGFVKPNKIMGNFTDKDMKDFADKLFDSANKATAGHMVEPQNIDEEKAKSFEQWVEKQLKTK